MTSSMLMTRALACTRPHSARHRWMLLLVLLAAVSTRPAAGQALALAQLDTNAYVRAQMTAGYARWGKARLAFDTVTFQAMLTPDFWVLLNGRKMSRQEFIDIISRQMPGTHL